MKVSAFNDNSPPLSDIVLSANSIWTPVRQELRAWFRREAPSLSTAYEGAVELIGNTVFPGRVHLIAHCVRDIADRLVFVLDPQIEGSRVQYENELDDIQLIWPNMDNLYKTDQSPSALETVPVPWAVASRIDKLVQDHRNRRRRPSQYEMLFRLLMRNNPSRAEVNRRNVEAFKDVRGWFMRYAHFPSNLPDEVNGHELQRRFESFEKMLHSLVGSFFTGTRELDAILQQANQ